MNVFASVAWIREDLRSCTNGTTDVGPALRAGCARGARAPHGHEWTAAYASIVYGSVASSVSANTLASPMRLSSTQYSSGWWALSSIFEYTTAG